MENNGVKVDAQVVTQLADTAVAMTRILDQLSSIASSKQVTHEKDIEYFRDDLEQVRNAIARIAKVLHEGNGEKPLITRVAILETATELYRKDLEEIREWLGERLDKVEEREDVRTKAALEAVSIGKTGKWKLMAAVATGVTGLLTSIVSMLGG